MPPPPDLVQVPTTRASAGAGTSDLDAEEDEVARVELEDEMLRLATEMSLADASGS